MQGTVRDRAGSNQNQSANDVRDVSISRILGISAEEVLRIWKQLGAPIIYLGRGENCEDMEKLLMQTNPHDYQLQAIKGWLDKNAIAMARS